MGESLHTHWIYKQAARRAIVVCAILSFVSVCFNTPATIKSWSGLRYLTICTDILVGIMLTSEMCLKIRLKGLIRGEKPYLKDLACIFDFIDTLFIWISVLMQASELWHRHHVVESSTLPYGLLRVPRALIIIRGFRYFLSSGSGQMTAIVLRASQHIAGVTLFLVFFIVLYGILGVQMFGDFSYHCVTNDTDPGNVSLHNLAIPDITCSENDDSVCPTHMVCMNISLTLKQRGYGSFDNMVISIKTVYESASQEGWVFLMYRSTDSYQDWLGYFYFISLIFFLAWLVKNVFIAVIIDAFAEIRVQLHNLWGNTGVSQTKSATQILSTEGESWHLIAAADVKTQKGLLEACRRALRSRCFHIMMQVAIILNVGILAFQPRLDQLDQDGRDRIFFTVAELIFTIIFDLEAVMKICCLGYHVYFFRSTYQYEAFLALMTTVNKIYSLSYLRSFPVLRIMRLVKLSPTLEGFVYKILGPARKIGALIIFTFSIVILMSCLSMQMFCYVEAKTRFDTFPEAFMSMFQILTQEGWIDVMQDTMNVVSPEVQPIVCIYFILYHFFATTVLICLFVAVILDNLELDENVKRLKQLKLNEQSVDTKQKLPWRLRIFGHFPNRPQMASVSSYIPGEFHLPHIRESYMRQFLDCVHPYKSKSMAFINAKASADGGKIPDSLFVGVGVLSSLGVQIVGGTGSSKHAGELKRDVSKKSHRTNSSCRRRLRGSMCEQKKAVACLDLEEIMKLEKSDYPITSGTTPGMFFNIMKNCMEHRRIVSIDNRLGGSQCYSLLRSQHLTRQERPMRTERVTFAEETRQHEMDNMNVFQKQPLQEVDFKVLHLKQQEALLKRERQERELKENHPLFDTPLFVIARASRIRKICYAIVYAQYKTSEVKNSKSKNRTLHFLLYLVGLVTYLDWIMILVTVGSCIFMMMETPQQRVNNTLFLLYAEYGFVFCMSIELILKLTAGGLFFTPKPILKDFGGVLDCFIYLVSLIFICTVSKSVPAQSGGQVLMVLRCLRPLRIFRLVPQIRKVVIELFRGFKDILMVSILLVALMFVFASFGVQMYGGRLAACNDRSRLKQEDCHGIFFQHVWISNSLNFEEDNPPGFMVPRVWTNPRNFDFDNIGSAMLTLFEVLSLKGWIEVRDIIIERFGMVHGLYIHIFVFLGSMVGLTLFIGVVVANYNENKGTALLTVDQRRWENLKCRLKIAQPLHLPPRPNREGIRAKAYDFSQHKYFKHTITLCIVLQSLLLFMKWASEATPIQYLAIACVVFNIIFAAEIVIKWIGMTFMGMMRSWRNRYDLLVTSGGIVWIFAYCLLSDKSVAYNAGVCLIVLRFLSICGKQAVLKMLLMTVAVSVYKSLFIIGAMFLLMLCYAYAGVVLFGTVKYGENINRHANFGSASLAIAVLFRIVTGEDWNKIMHDCMIQPPRCTPAPNYWQTDCGNMSAALMYFCSFYVIIAYIMLNVLVAIIMENFSLFYTMDEEILLSYNYLHMFQVTWNLIDVKRKGLIAVKYVKLLLQLLEGRLELDPEKDRHLLKHMCYEMYLVGRRNAGHSGKLMENNGGMSKNEESTLYVSFHDVLMMLAYRSIDIRKSLQLEELLMREKREAEIEEAVAKMTICHFIYKCIKKSRQQKIHQPSYLSNMMDGRSSDRVVIIQVAPSEETKSTDEQPEHPSQGDSDSSFTPKGGKARRAGIWKEPTNYLCAPTVSTSSHRKPSIVESDSKQHELMNKVKSWWSESMDVGETDIS